MAHVLVLGLVRQRKPIIQYLRQGLDPYSHSRRPAEKQDVSFNSPLPQTFQGETPRAYGNPNSCKEATLSQSIQLIKRLVQGRLTANGSAKKKLPTGPSDSMQNDQHLRLFDPEGLLELYEDAEFPPTLGPSDNGAMQNEAKPPIKDWHVYRLFDADGHLELHSDIFRIPPIANPPECGIVGNGAELPTATGDLTNCAQKVAAAGVLSIASGAAFKGVLTGLQHKITQKPLPGNALVLWSNASKIGLCYGGSRIAINALVIGANHVGGPAPYLAPIIGGTLDALLLGRPQHIEDAKSVFGTKFANVSKCATGTLMARDISSQMAAFLFGPIVGGAIAGKLGIEKDHPAAKIGGGIVCSAAMTPFSVAANGALEWQQAGNTGNVLTEFGKRLKGTFSSVDGLSKAYNLLTIGRVAALCTRAALPVALAQTAVETYKAAIN
ncbi:MAG: hypothetical protein O3A01_07145 [bacterium]|nr:hypothetical protein [bacterium]